MKLFLSRNARRPWWIAVLKNFGSSTISPVQAFGKTLSVGADAAPATEINYFIDKCDGAAIHEARSRESKMTR